uniref:Acetolactate synthase n=1 Tax=Pyramimonas obovata TaxID=1411642 RepID=A0A7S0MT51_9CHLO|mmetsp:Transcript_11385/g.23785  ORF Transcript_11385/g.23785 Transcript_11385/m.23785 type:complete len:609 (+) Transcript_11385:853-2679(+)
MREDARAATVAMVYGLVGGGVMGEGWGVGRRSSEQVECLEREGVDLVFAYPGGASMEIHQALTRSNSIRNILCRHEQGEIFAAEGYAKVTGKTAVCIATSGPGATNLVTGLADAMLDSVPMVAITGQVPRPMIGTDGFQETPIVEITRQITKHNYLVTDLNDLPRIMREAFLLANTGRPGPVLVDVPKDIQQQLTVPEFDVDLKLSGYLSRLPPACASPMVIQQIIQAMTTSERPMLYIGGGTLDAHEEIKELVELTGIPVAQTLMGLGAFPVGTPKSMDMLGMHGTVVANYSIDKSDLLLAIGVRFDDRVTGKLEKFATRARIVHIDIDPAEINKNKEAHMPVCADCKPTVKAINDAIKAQDVKVDYSKWQEELDGVRNEYPMSYPQPGGEIIQPQHAIQVLHELTEGKAIISTGVGQHQMFAAQWYHFAEPRNWVTSGGLGSMGFGLPSAIGAQVARPDDLVVDIDGDGSFVMNIQELATLTAENIPVKCMILNNQHLGMVVQWEDRFYKANRAHTYLGVDGEYHVTGEEADIFPDFVTVAEGFRVPAKRVTRKSDLKAAIQEMIDTPGPYLLDVMVPHQEHVLPMIPGGGSFADIITSGSGHDSY